MTRLVLSSLRAIGFAAAAVCAASALLPARRRRQPSAKPAKPAPKSGQAEGGGLQALPGRDLRRLERVRRRSRQGTHLLHPCATEIARTREPQARSGLCVHLRPPGGRGAQRSVVHHGLRRRGGRRRRIKADAKPGEKASKSERQIEDVRRARPRSPWSTRRRSRCYRRAETSGSRTQRKRAR